MSSPAGSLSPGHHVGPYEIEDLLGAGGMGEVYRARDVRLGRDVALKVLTAGASDDPTRQARFEMEARSAGALNHPNILSVFDTGRHEGLLYIVFELLEGQTLRSLLASGPLPVSKAVDLGVQLAIGLAAAHDRGIVHRDLKPDNVFITREGRAKILDFGLAKLQAALDDGAPPPSDATPSELTSPGSVLGTVAYMSPEQVKGLAVTPRSDIFSLGTVLYEAVSGKRAFAGATAGETMAAILKDDPEDLAILHSVPLALCEVVRRCLEKRPDDRFGSAHDLAIALEVARSGSVIPGQRFLMAGMHGWVRPLVVVGLSLIALSGWTVWRTRSRPSSISGRSARLTIPLPEGTVAAPRTNVGISRDGMTVAAVARKPGEDRVLYVRGLDEWNWRRLVTADDIRFPFFSQEGDWLGYFAQGKMMRIPVTGGAPQAICEAKLGGSARWGEDGRILFTDRWRPGVWRVDAAGGVPELVVPPGDAGGLETVVFSSPWLLPNGRALLVSIWSRGQAWVEAVPLDGRPHRRLVGGGYGRYTSSGHLVYSVEGKLFAIAFDPDTLTTRGVGVPLVTDLRYREVGVDPSGAFAISDTGTLVYTPESEQERQLVWVDRAGTREPLPFPPGDYSRYAISPDSRRLAVTLTQGSTRDVWLGDLGRGTLSRLTTDGDSLFALWSQDGHDLVYASRRDGAYNVYRARVDSGAAPTRLTSGRNAKRATSWSPDGRSLIIYDIDPVTRGDIWLVPLEGTERPHPLIKTMADELQGMISPDGRWLAFTSDESGRREVYVASYPTLGDKRLISTGGGALPFWGPANELFFAEGDRLMSVPISGPSTARITTARMVGRGEMVEQASFQTGSGALTRDGQRFLFVDEVGHTTTRSRLHVIRDWFEELDRRVPVN